jgi:hypothetical protein
MIPIAGVLLLIIVVFSVAVVVSNPGVFELSIFGATIPVTAAGVYFTGAGAMLVLILAAALMRRGLRREMARRKQVKALQNAAGVKSLPTTPRASKDSNGSRAAGTAQAQSASTKTATGTGTPVERTPGREIPSGETPVRTPTVPSSNDGAKPEAGSTLAERQALLDEAEELTGDSTER